MLNFRRGETLRTRCRGPELRREAPPDLLDRVAPHLKTWTTFRPLRRRGFMTEAPSDLSDSEEFSALGYERFSDILDQGAPVHKHTRAIQTSQTEELHDWSTFRPKGSRSSQLSDMKGFQTCWDWGAPRLQQLHIWRALSIRTWMPFYDFFDRWACSPKTWRTFRPSDRSTFSSEIEAPTRLEEPRSSETWRNFSPTQTSPNRTESREREQIVQKYLNLREKEEEDGREERDGDSWIGVWEMIADTEAGEGALFWW